MLSMGNIGKIWGVWVALLTGWMAPLQAGNDCVTATPLALVGGACTWSSGGAVALGGACPTPVNDLVAGCTAGCTDQAWFRFQPNDPANQYDVSFTLTLSNAAAPAGEFQYYLLYAEASDSGNGDPCSWVSASPAPFSARKGGQSGCVNLPAGGNTAITFNSFGLDGSAIYYLVVTRVTGTGGTVDICATTLASGPAPAQDRCATPVILTPGAGIDSQAALGGSGSWSDAAPGTNRFATKERITNECSFATGGTTEDHYFVPGVNCDANEALGHGQNPIFPPFVFGDCVRSLESTVYYQFQKPLADPPDNWFLHIGNTTCNSLPDSLEIMLVDQWDCGNAQNTVVLDCGVFEATGTYPTADFYFGPLTLNDFQDYGIIIDGVSGAQCTFEILLTRSVLNPVLPVGIEAFRAEVAGTTAGLSWTGEGAVSYAVTRSLDGQAFAPIGTVPAAAGQTAFAFDDTQLPTAGTWYYRLEARDVDGHLTYSTVVEARRLVPSLALHLDETAGQEAGLALRATLPQAAPATVEVRDLTGRLLYQQRLVPRAGQHEVRLPLLFPPGGLYLIRLQQASHQTVIKWAPRW